MKLKLLLAAACCLLPWIARAADAIPTQVQSDIARLQERQIVSDPDYWRTHLIPGGQCDGEKVATLLIELAKYLRPVANLDEALAVLAERRVFTTPDYWKKNAVAGRQCEAKNVAIVISRLTGQLPIPIPQSAQAKPLEPTPPAKLKKSYDIVIAGAGTGGCGAAVQAARMGQSVLLLDETDWIGGQMTAAGVTSMDEGGTLVRERGIYREWCGLVASYYQPLGINYLTAYWNNQVCVEPRIGRKLLHVLLGDARGAGVLDLVERTRVVQVMKQGNKVTGVKTLSNSESGHSEHEVSCRVLIDATEWGDVIPLTGARYRVGNCTSDAIDDTRKIQDNTWTAAVKQYPQGVPSELLIPQPPPGYTDKLAAAFAKTLVDGDKIGVKDKPWTWATFVGYRAMPDSSRPGTTPPITRTQLNYNNDYPATVAEISSPERRKIANRAMRLKTLYLIYYLQQTLGKKDWSVANDEGYDTPANRAEIDEWLAEAPIYAPYRPFFYQFSVIPYVRESRRIIGLKTLTAHEIDRNVGQPIQFPTTIALGDYPVDLHGSMTKQWIELDLDQESDIAAKLAGPGHGAFAIPFECFIPEKIDGFLPAEKNLSQSRLANGATRLQPHTMLMGQAVGVIASLAVQNKIQPREVDPKAVQRVLVDAGCTLSIAPVSAPWGTPEWKEQQLAIQHAEPPPAAAGTAK